MKIIKSLVFISIILLSFSPALSTTAIFNVTPSNIVKNVEDSFDVNIMVNASYCSNQVDCKLYGILAYEFDLLYDPNVLSYSDVTLNTLFTKSSEFLTVNTDKVRNDGFAIVGRALSGLDTTVPKNIGSEGATLATIHFKVKNLGKSVLKFDYAELRNKQVNEIPDHYTFQDGNFKTTQTSCSLIGASITPNCGGTCCNPGNTISMSGTVSGNCAIADADNFQIDASAKDAYNNVVCNIEYNDGDIRGINSDITTSETATSISDTWTIPSSIPSSCQGVNIYATSAGIYQGRPTPEKTNGIDWSIATGYFNICPTPSQTTTTSPSQTTTTTIKPSATTTTIKPSATTTTIKPSATTTTIPSLSCTDSDGGFYQFTKGTLSGYINGIWNSDIGTDECLSGTLLLEYYCSENTQAALSYEYDCGQLGAWGCSNGACYQTPSQTTTTISGSGKCPSGQICCSDMSDCSDSLCLSGTSQGQCSSVYHLYSCNKCVSSITTTTIRTTTTTTTTVKSTTTSTTTTTTTTTTTYPSQTPTNPIVSPSNVTYAGSKYSGSSGTFWCNVTDPDQDASTLDVRLWIGTCDDYSNCYATRYLNEPYGLSDIQMRWDLSSRRFKYDWTIPWMAGTIVAGTCNATDYYHAGSNQGDKYPLFRVATPSGGGTPIGVLTNNFFRAIMRILGWQA
jgi:hypothetical protein